MFSGPLPLSFIFTVLIAGAFLGTVAQLFIVIHPEGRAFLMFYFLNAVTGFSAGGCALLMDVSS